MDAAILAMSTRKRDRLRVIEAVCERVGVQRDEVDTLAGDEAAGLVLPEQLPRCVYRVSTRRLHDRDALIGAEHVAFNDRGRRFRKQAAIGDIFRLAQVGRTQPAVSVSNPKSCAPTASDGSRP